MTTTFRCAACGRLNHVDLSRGMPRCGACKQTLDATNAPFLTSDDDLDRLIASSPVPVLVDFYADWCGPCRTLAPNLQELARRHAGRIFVAKVDTERFQRKAQQLGVQGIPALFLYSGGKLVDQTKGAQPLPALERLVGPHV